MCNYRVRLVLSMLLLFAFSGCAVTSNDLLQDDVVTLVTEESDELEYKTIKVTQKGVVVKISGILSLDIGMGHGNVPGHMDIVISTKEGEVYFVGSAPYRRSHPSEPSNHARFEISINTILPDRTEVKLKHHSSPMIVHLPLI